jgi:hypothetical protein
VIPKTTTLTGHDCAIIGNALSLYASETREKLSQGTTRADLGPRMVEGLERDCDRAEALAELIECAFEVVVTEE